MKKITSLSILLLSVLVFGQSKNLDETSLAVQGYDLVSYFTSTTPQKGREKFQHKWEGARYLFATAQNKQAFIQTPSKYLPAYGGWCAYAMIRGKEVEINPTSYYIQQGQLHLFYKTKWVDTQTKWLKREMDYKTKADAAWAMKVQQNTHED